MHNVTVATFERIAATLVDMCRGTLVLASALLAVLITHMLRVIQVFSLQKSSATELQQLMVV